MSTSPDVEACVVAAVGRIDAATAPALDAQLLAAYEANKSTVIVELAEATYVSSSGLRILLLAHRRQRSAGGQLLLRNVRPKVMRILRLAGFDRVFVFRLAPGKGDSSALSGG